jgi:hypothetical protein
MTSDEDKYNMAISRKISMKDNQGRYRTLSLFKEYQQEGFKWYWTIPQLKKIYLEYNHIPHYEYEFANDHFEDWQHWEKVADGGMKFAIDEWRAERSLKLLVGMALPQSKQLNTSRKKDTHRNVADLAKRKSREKRRGKQEIQNYLKEMPNELEYTNEPMEKPDGNDPNHPVDSK